jgi:hypothetical protein
VRVCQNPKGIQEKTIIRIILSSLLMSATSISGDCKSNRHLECVDCMCKCHIPGTMENLAKKIAKLEKETPGVGESL